MEQKTVFKINWKDIQVVAIANRLVLVTWNGEKAWMEKSVFNRLSAYHEQESDPKSQFGTKPKIRPVFGLIIERVDQYGKTINVFETLK